jgi:hypothetical protein
MSKIIHRGSGAALTEMAIFKQVWMRSNKRSFISGLHLRGLEGTELFISCFAHVLAKGLNKYPFFRFYAKNLALLEPKEHHLFDNGTEEMRIHYALDIEEKGGTCDWKKLYDLRDELEKEYKKHFPSTFMGILNYKYDPEEVFKKVGKLNQEYFKSLEG